MAVLEESEQGKGFGLGGRRRRSMEACLRMACGALCVVAMAVMLKNKHVTSSSSLEYNQIHAFTALAYICGLAAAYLLISTLDSLVPRHYRGSGIRAWILLLLDQGFTYVVLASAAAAAEVLYVAYQGETEATWAGICSAESRTFCNRASASVVSSFCAMLCLLSLSILSSHRVFTRFDPPFVPTKDPLAASG